MTTARRRCPIPHQRDGGEQQGRRGDEPTAPRRLDHRIALGLYLPSADECGDGFPQIHEAERGPHAPGGEAPEEEVVAVAYLVRSLRIRVLRRAELEVQVIDEQ